MCPAYDLSKDRGNPALLLSCLKGNEHRERASGQGQRAASEETFRAAGRSPTRNEEAKSCPLAGAQRRPSWYGSLTLPLSHLADWRTGSPLCRHPSFRTGFED